MTSTNSNFYVPCVPISISANLVAAQPLAKRLAVSAPELAHLSLSKFASIQAIKSELRIKVDKCAMTQEELLDASVLNVGDLFSNLTVYLRAQDQITENSENLNLQTNLQDSLKQVHAYAAAMNLVAADYCLDGEILPEMLFVACLQRIQILQKAGKIIISSRLN